MAKVLIRTATPADAEEILKLYSYYVKHTAVSFEYEVPSLPAFREQIGNTLKKYPYLVAVHQGEIWGYGYTGPFHTRPAYQWSVETTVYIRSDKRGMGLGKLLYQALEQVSRAQNVQNLNACVSWPEADDPYLTANSREFHRHMGFSSTGASHRCGYKFGRWYGILWMEKWIGEHPASPPPMIPFPLLDAAAYLPFPSLRGEQGEAGADAPNL